MVSDENVLGNDVYDLEKGRKDVLDDIAVEDLSTAPGAEKLSAGGLSMGSKATRFRTRGYGRRH